MLTACDMAFCRSCRFSSFCLSKAAKQTDSSKKLKLVEKSEMLLIAPFLSLQRHGLSQMSTKWCNGRSQGWSCPSQNRIGIRLAKTIGKCDFPCVFPDLSVMQVFWAFVLSISAQSVHEPLYRFRLFSMFFRFNCSLFRKQLWSWLFDSLFNLISMSCPKINILSSPEGWRVPVSFVLHWTQIKKLRSRRVPGHKFILGLFERMKSALYMTIYCRIRIDFIMRCYIICASRLILQSPPGDKHHLRSPCQGALHGRANKYLLLWNISWIETREAAIKWPVHNYIMINSKQRKPCKTVRMEPEERDNKIWQARMATKSRTTKHLAAL